ncbi:MAG: hypothetical protein DRJ35_04785 [Thermoprotei archaeon]|nr:MAG: hypothetical protein DRJ35_04785 [Thermoprotei archaeon]
MTIRIARNRPVLALLVIESLSSESRRKIIKELLNEKQGLSASELSRRLGLTLPTILSHLDKLVATGIVRIIPLRERGRVQKLYRLPDKDLQMYIDLRLLANIPEKETLKEYLAKYIEESRRRAPLTERFDPQVIMDVLGVDFNTAIMLADYFNMSTEEIVGMLVKEAEALVREKEEVTLEELERLLRVTTYWAVKVANRLEELGYTNIRY